MTSAVLLAALSVTGLGFGKTYASPQAPCKVAPCPQAPAKCAPIIHSAPQAPIKAAPQY